MGKWDQGYTHKSEDFPDEISCLVSPFFDLECVVKEETGEKGL